MANIMGVGIYALILLVQNVICITRIDPLVETDLGLIRGLRASDGDYTMFLGIPYAKVEADRPFADATPYPSFEETFKAYDDSIKCPQMSSQNAVGSLDCLRLNVYVPQSATYQNRLPVMVYIHGGAFTSGSGGRTSLSPKFLVRHDVIVVTLNYRLGVYGFMCLDVADASGNQGLKDQLIALKWIKNNIHSFAGDADKITLFGESAGAHSIDLHLLSPHEKLYSKVILQSGAAVAATVLYEPDKSAALNIAKFLGFEARTSYAALKYLATVNTNLVVAAASELNIVFKPCAESNIHGVEPFITKHWVNTEVPKVKNMAVMAGFAEEELAIIHYFRDSTYDESVNTITEYFNRTFEFSEEKFVEMRNLVSNFYFGDKDSRESVKWGIIQFDSDFTYIHPMYRTMQNYLKNGVAKIYYYMFTYVGGRNFVATEDEYSGLPCCAGHADMLHYLFDTELKAELNPTDEVIMERLTAMWTNFAKYSDPTPETTELLPVPWLPFTKEETNYLKIDTEFSLRSRPHNKRMAFWDLFYKYNKKSQRWYNQE